VVSVSGKGGRGRGREVVRGKGIWISLRISIGLSCPGFGHRTSDAGHRTAAYASVVVGGVLPSQ